MHAADVARRRAEEEAVEQRPAEEAGVPPELESVLSLQRAAGNASVVRMLWGGGSAPVREGPATSEADEAVARSLARAVAARNAVKQPDAGAEEPEVETGDFEPLDDEEEGAELEGEQQLAPAGSPALTRWPWGSGSGTKAKTAKPPKAPTMTSKTTFRAPDRSSKARTTIAVGEQVAFKGSKAGTWAADAGLPVTGASGKTFVWTAPDRAASATITLTVGTQTVAKTMTVVEPTSITGSKVGSDLSFPAGDQGAGMRLRFKYSPLNVSFGNIEVKEVSGPATNVTGYYSGLPAADLWHDSGDLFTRIGKDNKDTAIDTASFTGDPPPWTDGGWDWVIPNNFKTITEGGDGKQFTTVTQSFFLEGPPKVGRSKVTKAGVSTAWRSP